MGSFEQIDIEKAKDLMDSGQVTIVDIRDKDSYTQAHIANAIRVDEENVEDFLKRANKSKPLICYCYHGISSQGATEYFHHQGFEKVYSIQGGFEHWRTVYPTVSH